MGKYLGDLASNVYGVHGNTDEIQPLIPRSKYQFTCIWTIGGGGASASSFPMTRISSVTMPGHQSRVSVQNQYNKKRLIHTGVDYSPVTMKVYDDRSGEVEKFLQAYSGHYFSGVMANNEQKFSDDLISEEFAGGANNSATGLVLRDQRYFFKDLQIIRLNTANDSNKIILRNPVISQIEGDNLDYSDSGPVSYTLQIQYEGYHIENGSSDARAQFHDGTNLERR